MLDAFEELQHSIIILKVAQNSLNYIISILRLINSTLRLEKYQILIRVNVLISLPEKRYYDSSYFLNMPNIQLCPLSLT